MAWSRQGGEPGVRLLAQVLLQHLCSKHWRRGRGKTAENACPPGVHRPMGGRAINKQHTGTCSPRHYKAGRTVEKVRENSCSLHSGQERSIRDTEGGREEAIWRPCAQAGGAQAPPRGGRNSQAVCRRHRLARACRTRQDPGATRDVGHSQLHSGAGALEVKAEEGTVPRIWPGFRSRIC